MASILKTIDLLEDLSEEVCETGWRKFYDKYLL